MEWQPKEAVEKPTSRTHIDSIIHKLNDLLNKVNCLPSW